jgi:hypothetical protein
MNGPEVDDSTAMRPPRRRRKFLAMPPPGNSPQVSLAPLREGPANAGTTQAPPEYTEVPQPSLLKHADGDTFAVFRGRSMDEAQTKLEDESEDDLPVLTDVVPGEDATALEEDFSVEEELPEEDIRPACEEARIDDLIDTLKQALAERLDQELPGVIEASLRQAGEELRTRITGTVEALLEELAPRGAPLERPPVPAVHEPEPEPVEKMEK